jgi:hypothetical protein
MTHEAGQFDEGLGAAVIRKQPTIPDPSTEGPIPLTADILGAFLCRIDYVRIGTGEEGSVIVAPQDWQRWMDEHGLVITRRTP